MPFKGNFDISQWKQVGGQEGSNEGGYFEDSDGQKWYCKFPADDKLAQSEVLAAKLYAACGIDVPELNLVKRNGKTGIASKFIPGLTKAKDKLSTLSGVIEGFAVDAWLCNWDVVGLGYDNLLKKGEKAVRIDVGGALEYRAQGKKKGAAFGDKVTELDSLRDVFVNPQAASVFASMTADQIKDSVRNVLKLSDQSIRNLCYAYGPGAEAEKEALAEKLVKRKHDLAEKFPEVAEEFRS